MKVSKSEKDVLLYAVNTTMGAFSLSSNSPYWTTCTKLVRRGWVKHHQTVGMSFGLEYYALTEEGWKQASSLKGAK